nr:MAG TPA: hypothetical protein [Caudoviricetes sp.]
MEDKIKKIISYPVIEVCFGMDFISEANSVEEYAKELYRELGDDIFELLERENVEYGDILEEIHKRKIKIEP